jgi:hypothetical protein
MDEATGLAIRNVLGQLTKLLQEATLLTYRRNKEWERKEQERESREELRQLIKDGICPECDGKLKENQHGGEGRWICENCKQRYY